MQRDDLQLLQEVTDYTMYVCDFVLMNTKSGKNIVIEIDGSSHYYDNNIEDPIPLGKT